MGDRDRAAGVAFIGFGEAGMAFAAGWGAARPDPLTAYDIKSDDTATRAAMDDRYAAHGVTGAGDPATAVARTAAVFSVVTADQALVAAQAAAPHLAPGTLWLDCNSCAPQTKQAASAVINEAGGRYVDVAVMAPVHPKRHHVPLLVAGPHADAACAVLHGLDMRPQNAGPEIGQASAIKMLRSVMIKGLEALTAECFLAARAAGVEAQVLASLEASDPDIQWAARAHYNLDRMMVHGTRRAAEMAEVVRTVEGLGLPAGISAGTVAWEARVGALGLSPGDEDLWARADRVLARLKA